MIYLNEIDPFACEWVRNLMSAGLVPEGVVDERPIQEVRPEDLKGYTQHHFFSGILGWPLALALAGVEPGRPLWTASCPCQPFSTAGRQKGAADERHLWPVLLRLVRECRPPVLFGEQVASSLGRGWLAGVRSDLEAAGYAVGCADLCAAGAGAPHIRQRLYWGAVRLADAGLQPPRQLSGSRGGARTGDQSPARGAESDRRCVAGGRGLGRLADSHSHDAAEVAEGDQAVGGQRSQERRGPEQPAGPGAGGGTGGRDRPRGVARGRHGEDPAGAGDSGRLGDTDGSGLSELRRNGAVREEQSAAERPGGTDDFWSAFGLVPCRDGKVRRVEPGSQPLAHGLPLRVGPVLPGLVGLDGVADLAGARRSLRRAKRNRVGRLKGYGNAIVPELAAVFVRAFLESIEDLK